MKIKYLGHSGFQFSLGKFQIVVDPFITHNPLCANKVDLNEVAADFILLTHAHEDHIADAESLAQRTGAVIISVYEVATHFQKLGLEAIPMNIGGTIDLAFGNIRLVNAVHSSSFPNGKNGGGICCGFVISSENQNFYISGDTALTLDMKLIPMLYQKLDFAILCIGNHFTMGVDDAIVASNFIKCDQIIGCHYNTFPPIEIDKTKSIEKFKSRNKELILMDVGSVKEI